MSETTRALNAHYRDQQAQARARLQTEALLEPWRCSFRYRGQRPGDREIIRAATPRELVQRMAARFAAPPSSDFVVELRIHELQAPR